MTLVYVVAISKNEEKPKGWASFVPFDLEDADMWQLPGAHFEKTGAVARVLNQPGLYDLDIRVKGRYTKPKNDILGATFVKAPADIISGFRKPSSVTLTSTK